MDDEIKLKPEFISKRQNVDVIPETDKKKMRGCTKNRPRANKNYKNDLQLCSKVAISVKCDIDTCKRCHNIDEYLSLKIKDLDGPCPFESKLDKFCPYGLTCRYSKSHSLKNLNSKDVNTLNYFETFKSESNAFNLPTKLLLQKKKYNFETSKSVIAGICLDLNRDREDLIEKENNLRKNLKTKLYLAPLTTLGNLPFRRVCIDMGAEITCSEMILATSLLRSNVSEHALLRRHESEKYFGIQLAGGFPDTMTKATQYINENCNVDFIDINCGCPIDLICNKGAGSMLMVKKKKLFSIVDCMHKVSNVPITVKIRTGIKYQANTSHLLLKQTYQRGAVAVTMHGRSKDQRYTKRSDWDYLKTCSSDNPDQIFIGNGDIYTQQEYYQRLNDYGCENVMIGRGALIKPWIFREIKDSKDWDISASERFEILKKFTNYGLIHWGSDLRGIETCRRFLLEWLSFLYRYVPIGVLEYMPPNKQKINEVNPEFVVLEGLYIVAAKRTAFGVFGGKFLNKTSTDLQTVAAQCALNSLPQIKPSNIDSVVIGNCIQSSVDAAYISRHVALRLGIPVENPAYTINRLCGSGFQSIVNAVQEIKIGDSNIVLTGGSENMSMSPYASYSSRFGNTLGLDMTFKDTLWSALTDMHIKTTMGETAELLADKYDITRDECDNFAYLSQTNWKRAFDQHVFDDEIAPVNIKVKGREESWRMDEHPRPNIKMEMLNKLPTVFRKNGGRITAGNASGICDGAGCVIVASEEACSKFNLKPLAEICAYSVYGCDPKVMGIGPVKAIQEILKISNMSLNDLSQLEINEAFSAQSLAVIKELQVNPEIVNINGGAISMGHPLAASGSRISAHLANRLNKTETESYSIGSACIGGGQGIAIMFKTV
ncbi:hypothetical protein A3Q56_01168 [Intoshia linei]|uniref:tRNA-dihydrouridine(47) synthase [NAD(P)(+)] n=1 Tax=Intoshia linei TaxID=1819745 RepID=A0A177B9T4_9BILA|nr:hypothetical protein A3Q56_01168 [Intoshia linei]